MGDTGESLAAAIYKVRKTRFSTISSPSTWVRFPRLLAKRKFRELRAEQKHPFLRLEKPAQEVTQFKGKRAFSRGLQCQFPGSRTAAVRTSSVIVSGSRGCAGRSPGSSGASAPLVPRAGPRPACSRGHGLCCCSMGPLPTTPAPGPCPGRFLFSESLRCASWTRPHPLASGAFCEKTVTSPTPVGRLPRRPPGQQSERVPGGAVLVRPSEGGRISASPEPAAFSE